MKLSEIRVGNLGGTLCCICASVTLGDLLQTMVMAALGTLVSYGMSRLLVLKNKMLFKVETEGY